MYTKIDYKKQLKQFYNASRKELSIINVPPMNFLAIDGKGHPDKQEFQDAVQTIYTVAYVLKFMIREKTGINYGVMPLEANWTLDRKNKEFYWTMMIMQPELVTRELYKEALEKARLKKNPPALSKIRLEEISEGLCVQVLHVGPYNEMNATLDKMLEFVMKEGYVSGHDTHDIYLNDKRKTKPENLKTIMRLQVKAT